MTFLETILDELLKIFKKHGINSYTEQELIELLDIRQSTFDELFPSREDMVNKVVRHNNEIQVQQHKVLLATASNAVEEIVLLLQYGIKDIQTIGPQYIKDLQSYPEAWQIGIDFLNTYSYHQLYDIINKGIVEGLFRKDINIQVVVKIILEQIFMIINPVAFPSDKYDLSEVFRSVYLYYMRGLCTDKGGKLAEEFFSKNSL